MDDIRYVPTGQKGASLAPRRGRLNETLGRYAGRGVPLSSTNRDDMGTGQRGANIVSRDAFLNRWGAPPDEGRRY